MSKKYYLGLDMGTSSVGWAVTDENYNLLRARGKDLWGVRLFQEANTAAERRSHRTARRRLQREKARIGYLKEIFADEILAIDPGFYQRLEDSKYFVDDKTVHQPYAIFADSKYTDKEYHKEYPTIFHLRKELIESKEPHDVRLVFLAILNMYKHRGHFLNASLNDKGMEDISELYRELCEYEIGFCPLNNYTEMEDILTTKELSNSKRAERLIEIMHFDKKSPNAEMIKLICGLTVVLSKAFVENSFTEENQKYKISFRDSNFDEKLPDVEDILEEKYFEVFLLLKRIHDSALLANFMKDENGTCKYISVARVNSYNKHKYDLAVLKRVYKRNLPGKYNAMFRKMEENNYSAYSGSTNYKGIIRRGAKAKYESFCDVVKKTVATFPADEDTIYILSEIEKNTFLPKQLTASNGIIPNQLHKIELKVILKNAEDYLPFLREKDETGLTNSEKIVALFEFQIPYYVGPLFNDQKHGAWSVRTPGNEKGRILPWNFEEKIDVKTSAEKFIEKMVNHCTYLSDEVVLPKNSLLYEKFRVLNELNNLKINGEAISVSLKQDFYNNLFISGKKVTAKKIKEHLKIRGLVENKDDVDISGIDGDFINTLSNYAKFRDIFDVEKLTYEQEQIAENIIFWSTVYGESKTFLQQKLIENYGEILSKEQIKRITGIKFKDWGRLSKEFLYLEGADRETGEVKTIISRMWDENYNLMELLSSNFTYLDKLQEQTLSMEKSLSEIVFDDLDGLYLSAPVKRMTWQTIRIMQELNQVLGCEPAKIFVEMARDTNAPKERKDSRKKKFLDLYKNCKKESHDWIKEISETEDSKFKSKKLYLYYTQKGRCMYTGEEIDLGDLFNDNLYDIDHIYPRHFVKDDSIENNLVLVKKEKNAHKSDVFPIEYGIREKCHGLWKMLLDGGFITKEKYSRLIRTDEFSDSEMADFVNRQIVETRQGTKFITQILKETCPACDVVYVKAGNVSEFRRKYEMIKCREVNDLHHACDAYLNIVVGNVYHVKFTNNPLNYIKEYRKNPTDYKYHMDKIFNFNVERGNTVAWIADNQKSISIVKKVMKKKTPLVTRMSYEFHGGLADQTIYSAKEAKNAEGKGYIPIKATDEKLQNVCRYGGYKKFSGAYFFLVEHVVKGKKVRTLETVPLYLKDSLDSTEKLEDYCKNVLQCENPSVRVSKIKMYSLIKVNGFYLYLTGRSGNQLLVSNAVQLTLDYEQEKYVKEILNTDNIQASREISREKNIELYDILTRKHAEGIYSKRPNAVGSRLVIWREKYITLDIEEQIFVLKQILQLSQLSNMGADLSSIGGVKKSGIALLNKKISDSNEFKIIHKSPAGLFESETDLLRV